MTISEKLQEAYTGAKNYPNLAARLINAGVLSYTVDTASQIILYRFASGVIHLSEKTNDAVAIAPKFSEVLTIKAIRDNQQGKTTFPQFMLDIAVAGVRFYEATLDHNPRVTYIGIGGYYTEIIPL